MASTPAQDPDNLSPTVEGDVEHPGQSTRGPGIEDSPGTEGGTAGTGDGSGQSLVQDEEFER